MSSLSEMNRQPTELAARWSTLVQEDSALIDGLDGTSTMEWFFSLRDAHPDAQGARVISIVDRGQTVSILPVAVARFSAWGEHLQHASDVYGGRNGPLVANDDAEIFIRSLSQLSEPYPRWISMKITVVEGGRSEKMLLRAAELGGFAFQRRHIGRSPFIYLKDSEEEFRKGLSSGFQQNLRSSMRKAAKAGEIKFVLVDNVSQHEEFWAAINYIELHSWKQGAGTSITAQHKQEAFYRDFIRRGLDSGLVRSMIMYIDDKPIAYQLGLARSGVYSCLKNTMIEGFGQLRPSYLLKMALFDSLRAAGVKAVDLMGNVEPHKVVWANPVSTYGRVEIRFFRRSLRAQAYRILSQVKEGFARKEAPQAQQGEVGGHES